MNVKLMIFQDVTHCILVHRYKVQQKTAFKMFSVWKQLICDLDLENFEHLIFVAQTVLNILEEPATSKPVVPTYVTKWHIPKNVT